MRSAFSLEVRKCRHRKIWVMPMVILCFQLLWTLWTTGRMKGDNLKDGWAFVIIGTQILNCLTMPVLAAVTASRVWDMEHKGQTLKLLKTLTPASRIFHGKLSYGYLWMLICSLLQTLVITAAGILQGFYGPVPYEELGYAFLVCAAVNLIIYLFYQILAMEFVNQLIPLTAGLLGAFVGFLSNLFPKSLGLLIPWGYYSRLSSVLTSYDLEAVTAHYTFIPIPWQDWIPLVLLFAVLYPAGRMLLRKKEV